MGGLLLRLVALFGTVFGLTTRPRSLYKDNGSSPHRAMGGGEGEPAATHIPGTVSDGCPAFVDGCPYSKNDEMIEWIKAGREG